MSEFKCLAFDLDDTLIDTTRLLVPHAARQAFEAMKTLGLICTFADCEEMRTTLAKSMSHKEIFYKIAEKYGPTNQASIGKLGVEKFYNPEIPEHIPLMEGALELLEYLKIKYTLFLVTSGATATQEKKLAATGLKSLFKKAYLVDGFKNQKKQAAFEDILQTEKIQPSQLLSIGNRLHVEIRQAKICGAQTCYFKYGEHVGEKPEQPEDEPDFTVLHMRDIIATCHL